MSELEKMKSEAKNALVKEGMKRAVGLDGDDAQQKSKLEKLKGWLILGGSVVGLVVFLSLFLGLLQWLFGVLIVAGLGYGAYLVARPKLRALAAKSTEKRTKMLAEKSAAEAQAKAIAEEQKKKQALEDQMAALKQRVSREG
jgi:hypothetical protein